MLESQKKAIYNYRQKRKENGNPIKTKLKYVKCNICEKEYLNTNLSHHKNTSYHQKHQKIKDFINELQ